jgi:hypothetical protein
MTVELSRHLAANNVSRKTPIEEIARIAKDAPPESVLRFAASPVHIEPRQFTLKPSSQVMSTTFVKIITKKFKNGGW